MAACSPILYWHGPITRYARLWVAHASGMPGTFSPLPRVSEPDMHYGTCVTHVPWCMPGWLTSGCLWSRWRRKRSPHSRRMHIPQFYVFGKRPIGAILCLIQCRWGNPGDSLMHEKLNETEMSPFWWNFHRRLHCKFDNISVSVNKGMSTL